jgi:hypothetical protein
MRDWEGSAVLWWPSATRAGWLRDSSSRADGRRPDVVVEAEHVAGVVAVLERHQAAVGGLAIGGWHTLCVVAVQEVDVGADLVGLDGGEELLSRRTPTSAPSRNPTIDLSYDRWTSRNERPNQTTVKPILAGLGKHSVLSPSPSTPAVDRDPAGRVRGWLSGFEVEAPRRRRASGEATDQAH